MIFKENNIELYINGSKADLRNETSTNVKFQCEVITAEKLGSSQAEYSYTFNLPCTKNNSKLLEYANVLAKENKFNRNYKAVLVANGREVFSGSLLVNGYADGQFSCNLVSAKVKNLDDIFGDMTLDKINWSIPFNGVNTINFRNENEDEEVMFPLISYGVFMKRPYYSDDVANDYTSKYEIDKYNDFYITSFPPSLNMMQTIKKAFQTVDFEVGGNAFQDEYLKNIYMSMSISDDQTPMYNLAHPYLGSISLSSSIATVGSGYIQELNFPYFKASDHAQEGTVMYTPDPSKMPTEEYHYNFDSVNIYPIFSNNTTQITSQKSYLFNEEDSVIVIPADGYYKVELDVISYLNAPHSSTFTAAQWQYDFFKHKLVNANVSGLKYDMAETTPIEIQLVKNYDDNLELIKGKYNIEYIDGNPTHELSHYPDGTNAQNKEEWLTCYPHEDAYYLKLPTKENEIAGQSSPMIGSNYNYGYVYKDGELMAYDPSVNSNFICGVSSMGKCTSFIKNGYSWNRRLAENYRAFYNQNGYLNQYTVPGDPLTLRSSATTYNRNEYLNAPQNFWYGNYTSDGRMYSMHGHISGMVYLNKNDRLELFAVQRNYKDESGHTVDYSVTNEISFHLEAASPKSYEMLRANSFGYNSPSDFDYDLKLSNFLNKETRIADFIENILTAYNLQMSQSGNYVSIDKKLNINKDAVPTINLDNRVNAAEVRSDRIDYPKSMAVQYTINTDEWGFQSTIPQMHIEEDDWLSYGDSGFSVVTLNLNSLNQEEQRINLPFSYSYYYNYHWTEVFYNGNENSANTVTLTIPTISEAQYMIDRYDYDEAMRNDGYSLNLRFWHLPHRTSAYVWTASYPKERIDIFIPSNEYNDINLSYKNTEKSILTEYFNTNIMSSSNYITVNAFITADEYNMMKNGASVKVDDDTYITASVSGFDPSLTSPTQIKLIKKV